MTNDLELGNGVYKLQFHQLDNCVMLEINDPVNFMAIKITPAEIEILKTYLVKITIIMHMELIIVSQKIE